MSLKQRLSVLAVLLIGSVASAATSLAHFQTNVYTFKSCASDAKRVDPVNLVFYSWANTDQTVEQIQAHAGWTNTGGSTQNFRSHGVCGPMMAQRASGGVTSSRYHIRIRQTYHTAEGIGTTSTGDAHHEDFALTCDIPGHATDQNGDQGSGFDQGRRRLRQLFQGAGHAWSSVFWGNTRNFKQCDDGYAGSDGRVVFIKIHSDDH